MPDGPRYEDDFYAWTRHQAEVLRTMPVSDNRFDREHIAEEIEDLGKSERELSPQPDPPHHRTPFETGLLPGRATAHRLDGHCRRRARNARR